MGNANVFHECVKFDLCVSITEEDGHALATMHVAVAILQCDSMCDYDAAAAQQFQWLLAVDMGIGCLDCRVMLWG